MLNFFFDFFKKFFGAYEHSPKRQALKITCIYSLIGSLWILLSDKLVEFLIKERSIIFVISVVKGWVYVVITSVLIFSLVFTAMKKVTDSKGEIKKMNDELEKEVLVRTAQLEETNAELEEANAMLEEEVVERKKREKEIIELNDELENRVIERTNQLQDMNAILEEEINEKTRVENELNREKILMEAIFNSVPGMIYLYDDQNKLVKWNKKHTEMTGFSSEELVGMNLLNWYQGDKKSQKSVSEGIEMIMKDGFGEIEADLQMKNGTKIPMYFAASPVKIQGKIYFAGIGIDITERKKAEEEIIYLSYHDQLTGLYNRRFYEEELRILDTEKNFPITLVMSDVNGLKLTNDAFGHKAGDILLQKIANILKRECYAGEIVARIGGDEFVLLLPRTDEKEAEEIIHRINLASAKDKADNVILSISMGFAVKHDVSDDMNEVFKKAEDDMYRHKLSESSSIRSKTIDLIMNSLYAKNNREMLHSKRVSEICEAIAINMNFDKDDINQIRIAGLMHDIGKIGISDSILNKSGKLNNDEWNEIKRHSEIGYRILSSVNEFSEISEYVLAHHERWDGQGYPKGLKGKEILIQARIIAVADAYDAMVSDRAYRKALSGEEAINEIRRCSGMQFDPDIAKVFVDKILGKGLHF